MRSRNGTPHKSLQSPAPPEHSRDPSQDRVDRGRARSGLELPRKLFHSFWGFLAIVVWLSHPPVQSVLRWTLAALSIVATADLLRFRYASFETVYERYLGYFMREAERHRVNGVIYYLGGIVICIVFYPRDIATLSILILSLCDTSASVFGRLFGSKTWPLPFSGTLFGAKKSTAGTLAAVLTGTLASYIFFSSFALPGDEGDSSWGPIARASLWKGPRAGAGGPPTWFTQLPNPRSELSLPVLAGVCGLVAGVAEAIDVFGLDDNLTLPVLFGAGAWAAMWVLG